MDHPNAKKHLYVSLLKSGIRILGYVGLSMMLSPWAVTVAAILIISEMIGIVEELV